LSTPSGHRIDDFAAETPKPTHAETLDESNGYKGKSSKVLKHISACRTFAASIDKEREQKPKS
jgi:hypothetical protein